MAVINVKTYVADILESVTGLKDTMTSYPDKWDIEMPISVYRTTQKPYNLDISSREELQTHWTIFVEIYTDNGSLTDIRNEVVSKFSDLGFSGTGHDSNTAGLTRVVCEFRGIVDNKLRQVYKA